MANVPLVFAGCDTWDRSHPLIDGVVRPAGIDLTYVVVEPGDLFRRMFQYAEFESSEMSTSTLMAMISRGDDRLIGVPVFPSRSFRHGYVFVGDRAGIERPQDLAGKRVGVPEYQMTAAVWIRAFLEHDFGVKSAEVEWFEGGFDAPGYSERMPMQLSGGIRLSVIPGDKSLLGMLGNGELHAVTCATRPKTFDKPNSGFHRLFPNYREIEKEYFLRTGFFPIMHLVVVRRDVYERHRWIPNALIEAFSRARDYGWQRLRESSWLTVSLPWIQSHVEEIQDVFGGHPFPYGFEANYATLKALTEYSFEQGLSTRKLEPEEIFATETLTSPANTGSGGTT